MKIAATTDPHFVSPDEPMIEKRNKRLFFADAWPSFQQLTVKLRQEAPDLIVCLGDMVDWYSEENRDFALSSLINFHVAGLPFQATMIMPQTGRTRTDRSSSGEEGSSYAKKGWQESGIELHNRADRCLQTDSILLDSALSEVPEGTREWLRGLKGKHSRQLLFTHVPLDLPITREYILSVDPERNMTKYVQSKAPWVYDECRELGISHVFTGHLHFGGDLLADGMRMITPAIHYRFA